MALRAGYYGVKRRIKDKIEEIVGAWDPTIASLFPRDEQAVLGAKNLLPNNGVTTTTQDITFTVNSDKTIIANGTASQNAYITLCENVPISKGDYIITGGNALIDKFSDYGIFMTINGTTYGTRSDIEKIHLEQDSIITICRVFVNANKQANNIKIEPMIRLATDPDDTYAPYAMTNKELTLSAVDQKTAINAIITAATDAADFTAFKTAMEAITPVTRSLSTAIAPEEIVKEEITEEPVVEKKTTSKKSTVKAENTKEV